MYIPFFMGQKFEDTVVVLTAVNYLTICILTLILILTFIVA